MKKEGGGKKRETKNKREEKKMPRIEPMTSPRGKALTFRLSPQAGIAHTILNTDIYGYLNCHELRVASLAALTLPTILIVTLYWRVLIFS